MSNRKCQRRNEKQQSVACQKENHRARLTFSPLLRSGLFVCLVLVAISHLSLKSCSTKTAFINWKMLPSNLFIIVLCCRLLLVCSVVRHICTFVTVCSAADSTFKPLKTISRQRKVLLNSQSNIYLNWCLIWCFYLQNLSVKEGTQTWVSTFPCVIMCA